MNSSKTIKDGLAELREMRAFHIKKTQEANALIASLESLCKNGDEQDNVTLSVHNQEFASSSIAEATAIVILRAARPLHVSEIVKTLGAGGYRFKAKNPKTSVESILHAAADKNRHGLIKKPKNTYSLRELEDRTIQ